MRRSPFWCLLAAVLASTACAAPAPSAARLMGSWVDHSESELLKSWGAPDGTIQLHDGSRIHVWRSLYGPAGDPIRVCRQSFVVDSEGTVERWYLSDCD